MKDKQQGTGIQSAKPGRGLSVHSGLRAGYSCPNGWWKVKEGKSKMCCHWVWKPGTGWTPECTT